jgi:hypothetical protein
MNAKGCAALALLAAIVLPVGGCMTGPMIESGVYGSSVDSDDLGNGYGGGAKIELNPIDFVSVDARASWIHFDDTDIDMIPLEVAGLLDFPILFEHIVPYIGVGTGYYMFDGDGGDLDDEVGYFPLAGLEIGLHSISIMVEARYLFLETDVRNGEGSLAGHNRIDVDGPALNAGLIFRF